VSNPDPVSLPAGSGWIEVCKSAADSWVQGSFPFTITQGTTGFGTYVVAVGQCTGAIPVPAGTYTVAEGSVAGYALAGVTSAPPGTLGTFNLGTQTANFTVNPGIDTTADFVNATQLNLIKVCKVLANDQGSLAGKTFTFNVSWTFSPATGATISSTGNGLVSVVAVPSTVQNGACTPVTNWGVFGIPVGSKVWVTENAFPNVLVSGVSITPVAYDAGTTATEAVLTVPPIAGGYASASFTNEPMGYVEVCKQFPRGYNNGTNFGTFTVNGGSPFTVLGGGCSAAIEVPAGTATVSEVVGSKFYLAQVTAYSGLAQNNELLTNGNVYPIVNPAIVAVTYGGVANETVVTFWNDPYSAQLKICVQETSPDANLVGANVNFAVSLASDPTLTIAAGPVPCTDILLPSYFPVVNPDGSSNVFTITESSGTLPPLPAGSYVSEIDYAGGGSAVVNSTLPALPATVTVTLGAGMNIVTFTDGRTAP
jgi:hypothetical protein